MEKDVIFRVSRWLGLFPFSSSGKFSVGLSVYSFALMLSAITVYMASFVYYYLCFGVTFTSTPEMKLSSVDIFQGLTSYLGFIVHNILVTKHESDFSEVAEFLSRAKPKKSFEPYVLAVGVAFLGVASFLEVAGYVYSMLYLLILSIYFGLLVQFTILLQFLSLVQFVKHEFIAIKNSIDVDRHEQLVTMGQLVNSLYGWQLLIFLLNFVASFITAAYNLVSEAHYYTLTREYELGLVTCASVILVFDLMELIYMSDVCASTCLEAEAFNHELFRMMRTNDRLCNNKKLHLYVTMKQNIEFTACGFFRIGYPLVTSIIAAATTYLVIIIQFSIPSS